MKRLVLAAIAAFSVVMPLAATAQTVLPNYGGYQGLKGTFRIGVQVFNPILNQTREQSFEQKSITDITDYLDPSQIAQNLGQFYNQQTRVSEVFDIRGVPVLAGYAQGSSILTINVTDPKTGAVLTDNSGGACSFTYNAGSRQASFNQFDADTDDDNSPVSQRIFQCLGRAWARYSPIDSLVGNPYSLQGTMARSAMDLSQGDSLAEQPAGANSAGDPWSIGGVFSSGSAGRFNLTRIDVRVNKGWRIFEGNRARLKIDLPFSYTAIKGTAAYSGQIGLGLEVPLIDQRWSIEPRVAYGITYSGAQGSVGHIVQGTVASIYALNGPGRGRFIIGNMAGYSTTLKTPGDLNLDPQVNNLFFRNGVAYDLPLKARVAGRSTNFRASYTFTNFTGTKLYNNNFHEMTVSLGLRGRDNSPRAFRDVLRLNFNTIQARGFSTYTVGLGFRF